MYHVLVRQALLVLMFCLLNGGNNCVAASINGELDWQVPILGVFRVPASFQATEVPDIQKIVDSQTVGLAAENNLPSTDLPLADAKDKLKSAQMDIAAYQLTMNDGQSYHLAWLIAVRDRIALDEATLCYFDRPLNIEQRAAAIMMQDKWNQNIDAMQYQDPRIGFGIKVVGLDQIDLGNISGKQAYAAGARFIVSYQEFILPIYIRCWIFNVGGNGGAMLLLTTDSERSFWTPILNSMMSTLRPLPMIKNK